MLPTSLPRLCRGGLLSSLALTNLVACDDGSHTPRDLTPEAQLVDDRVAPAVDLPFAQGGERLKAKHYVAGQAELFSSFHDDELDTDCNWAATVGADTLRCMPTSDVRPMYLDQSCTQPISRLPAYTYNVPGVGVSERARAPGDLVSALVDDDRVSACGAKLPPARVAYRIGEKAVAGGLDALTGGRRFYTCEGKPINTRADYLTDQYHLIPVPADSFVEGRLVDVDVDVDVAVAGGLSTKRVAGSDGSQQTLAAGDKGGAICALESDGTCVSGHATRHKDYTKIEISDNDWEDRDLYSDASCSSSLFRAIRADICGEPAYGIEVRDGRAHVYTLVPTQKRYLLQRTDGASSCLQLADDGFTSYARGTEVTSTLPAARRVRLGRGPLYQHQLASPQTNLLIPLKQGEPFVDDLGRPCTVLSAADGSLRCVPDRWKVKDAVAYSDAKCTKPLLASVEDDAELSDLVRVEQTYSFPEQVTGLYSLAIYEGTAYDGLDCAELKPSPFRRLLMRDKPLPLTILPEVTVSVR